VDEQRKSIKEKLMEMSALIYEGNGFERGKTIERKKEGILPSSDVSNKSMQGRGRLRSKTRVPVLQ